MKTTKNGLLIFFMILKSDPIVVYQSMLNYHNTLAIKFSLVPIVWIKRG